MARIDIPSAHRDAILEKLSCGPDTYVKVSNGVTTITHPVGENELRRTAQQVAAACIDCNHSFPHRES